MFNQTGWFLWTDYRLRISFVLLKTTWSTCEELRHVWRRVRSAGRARTGHSHHSVEVDSEIHVVIMEKSIGVLVLSHPEEG